MAVIDPSDIQNYAEVAKYEQYVVDSYSDRTDSLRSWKDRLLRLDDFNDGNWTLEMPDGRKIVDVPHIENRVLTTIEDQARLAGGFMPTIHVKASNKDDAGKADRRERVIRYYHQLSSTELLLPWLFGDMIASGFAFIKVWPDFTKPIEERFPHYTRLDPRSVWPATNMRPGADPHSIIVETVRKLRDLAIDYPAAYQRLKEQMTTGRSKVRGAVVDSQDIRCLEFYSAEQVTYVALWSTKNGKASTVLLHTENASGRIPVAAAHRFYAGSRPHGQIDPMLGPLVAENRLFTYILDYGDQMVYAPLKGRGVRNPRDFGPGAYLELEENGDIERISPANPSPELFRVTAELAMHSRAAGISPQARAGSISQSIGSASFVDSLQGPLVTNIRHLQAAMEVAIRQANEIAQLQDRTWCDAKKSIAGFYRGTYYADTYQPSKLIREGEYGNIVTYGVASGLDKSNAEVRIEQRYGNGLASQRWALSQLEGDFSVEELLNEITDEQAFKALVAGIYQQAAAGNLEPLARFQEARKKGEDPLLAMSDILAAAKTPPPAGTPEGGPIPASAAQQQAALQKGGIPGQAPTLRALPPLAQIRRPA